MHESWSDALWDIVEAHEFEEILFKLIEIYEGTALALREDKEAAMADYYQECADMLKRAMP